MPIHLGYVHEVVRYPVKSMAGIPTDSAFLGWHGLRGDRRFAFRRINDKGAFPWLSASRLHELILYHPLGFAADDEDPAPTHVRTPEGLELELDSPALRDNVAEKFGQPLELMKFKNGIFDDATVSVINLATIFGIARETGRDLDTRRFRSNIVLQTEASEAFLEDAWLGGRLVFGDDDAGPIVSVTTRDERCIMINLDPDTAAADPRIMKTVVRLNDNCAGVYATVVRTGEIKVGQAVTLITALS